MSANAQIVRQPALVTWLSRILATRSTVHNAALALVWVAAATSGFVFTEPCPTDLVTIALIVLLPTIGLFRFGPTLATLMLVLSGAAAFGLISTVSAIDPGKALIHTAVTIYLYAATIVIAGFVAVNPEAHAKIIFNGLCFAAAIAAALGIIGYFGLLPGSEIFTKYGRASGSFKDPNVFGPFLVAPLLYALHRALELPAKSAIPRLAFVGFLALAILLSFSRGAWMNLLVAAGVFLGLTFATAKTQALQKKIALFSLLGIGLIATTVIIALQFESVSKLLKDRASVSQSYDVGPEGRFGGQEKAVQLILEHPFGIGAVQFAGFHHHEEAHNVYLSMAMNAGWFGAAFYLISIAATLLIGLTYSFRPSAAQPYLIIALAVFAANVGEGIIIDTDHWRHIYLMMGIVWGISTAPVIEPIKSLTPTRRASDRTGVQKCKSA